MKAFSAAATAKREKGNVDSCHSESRALKNSNHVRDEDVTTGSVDLSNDDEQPTFKSQHQLCMVFALCLCTFCNAYLLISPFPYSGYMAMHLVKDVTPETTGFYAGLLSSAFMIGRACSSYGWGHFSDLYGRQTALVVSMMFSLVLSILFGMSHTFAGALLSRFLLGATSCIMVVVKTYSTELAKGDTRLEATLMGLSVGVRGWGFLLSPGISGFLSDPLKQYPNMNGSPVIRQIFTSYPYLLPNVAAALISFLSIIGAILYLEETLPIDERRPLKKMPKDILQWLISFFRKNEKVTTSEEHDINELEGASVELCEQNSLLQESNLEEQNQDLQGNAIKNNNQPNGSSVKHYEEENNKGNVLLYFWSLKDTRNALICYWLWSFVVISLDEMFPLFCLSVEGGLGWTESSIGQILSISGIPYVVVQYFVFKWLMDTWGMHRSLRVCSLLGIPPIAFLPLVLLWHPPIQSTSESAASPTTTMDYVFLSGLLATCRVFASSYFAVISLQLNRTVEGSRRGKLQGLSLSGASLFKGIGPTFAGALFSTCVSVSARYARLGSVVAFGVVSLLGLSVFGWTWIVMKPIVEH